MAPVKKKPDKPARDRSGALYAVVGDDILKALDEWVRDINASVDGPEWSRQDLVKAVLRDALGGRAAQAAAPDAGAPGPADEATSAWSPNRRSGGLFGPARHRDK